MKKLLLVFTLLFSTLMFSTPSYGEWTKVNRTIDGNTYYVDFDRIRKHDGYVFFWGLGDYLKPTPQGFLSFKNYQQGDCKLFRVKSLSTSHHKEPMGNGLAELSGPPTGKNADWRYPPPNSSIEEVLKQVCSR
jgi:hypothetical protein